MGLAGYNDSDKKVIVDIFIPDPKTSSIEL
jgi:hypothetical protein